MVGGDPRMEIPNNFSTPEAISSPEKDEFVACEDVYLDSMGTRGRALYKDRELRGDHSNRAFF